jgi:hypothetical protein
MTVVDAELALLLDVGSAWAKASAIGVVRGRWRVVAHAAQPTAWGAAELRRSLVERLAEAADARLVDRLDELVAGAPRIECHTARQPRRLVVVAVSRELSGGAARRAAEAAGWNVVDVVSLDDGRSLADRLSLLQQAEVDAWLLAGGFDGTRSPRALEPAALAAAARRPDGGPVVWAGSADLAQEVEALFEPGSVTSVPNPRPDVRRETPDALREHLQDLIAAIGGGEPETNLAAMSFPRAVAALASRRRLRVLAVDVGARAAVRALAEPDGTLATRVHAQGGLAGLAAMPGAAARVARLAGDAGDDAAIADVLQTLAARPATLPETAEELHATQVAARLQAAALIEEGGVGPLDLLVGAGRTIAAAPHPAQALRILLDGVRPLGVTQVAIDPAATLGPLGSLPDAEIGEGIGLLAEDLLVPLGTTVVTRGGDAGRPAMRVTVHRSGWPASSPIELRVGQLQVVPLPPGQTAELSIEMGEGVSIGAPRRSPRITATATGGAVGLVLDARGVPVQLPRRADDRRAVLAAWRDALRRETSPSTEHLA